MKIIITCISVLILLAGTLFSGNRKPFTVWAETSSGNYFDAGLAIARDSSGYIYIAGEFVGSVQFGRHSLESLERDTTDIFIAKFDSSGTCIWAVSAGGVDEETVSDIMVSSSGDIIFCGFFSGRAYFGETVKTSAGGWDMYIAGISPEGEWKFVKTFGGPDNEICRKVVEVKNQNFLIIGGYSGNFYFGSIPLENLGGEDAFISLCDNNFNPIWARIATGTENNLILDLTVNGPNFYVTGYTSDQTRFNEWILMFPGIRIPFVVNYNPSGDIVWLKAGGTSYGEGLSLENDKEGNVYLSGIYFNQIMWGDSIAESSGNINGYLLKMNSSGDYKWLRSFGGDSAISPIDMCRAGDALYITGSFIDEMKFAGDTLRSLGNNDIMLLKYSTDGEEEWGRRAGGDNQLKIFYDAGFSMIANQGKYTNEIYMTGIFAGNADFGDGININSGTNSTFLWKLADSRSYTSITVGSAKAEQSGEIEIPVYFDNLPEIDLKETDSVSFDLEYNFSMLFPMNAAAQSVKDKRRTSSYKLPFRTFEYGENDNVFALLDFKVGLGNDTITDIKIKNIKFHSDFLRLLGSKNGEFRLEDYCREGGTRLIQPYGGIAAIVITPNPVTPNSTLNIEMKETETCSVRIYDNGGAKIYSIDGLKLESGMNILPAGEITSVLPSGNYYLVISSDTGMGAVQIQKN